MSDGTLATAGDLIVRAGAIAGALVIIVGAISAVMRHANKVFAASIQEIVSDKLDQIKADTQQLKPNGGSSIADQIARVEARQIEIKAETRALREGLESHLAQHRQIS